MNIEAYDLDSLRKIIRGLQEENKSLKAQLRQVGAAYNEQDYFSDRIEEYEEYDPDQGARIYRPFITREHAQAFFKMFWGRQDVYAKRGRKGGYFPQCANRWNNYVCPKQHGEKQKRVKMSHHDVRFMNAKVRIKIQTARKWKHPVAG